MTEQEKWWFLDQRRMLGEVCYLIMKLQDQNTALLAASEPGDETNAPVSDEEDSHRAAAEAWRSSAEPGGCGYVDVQESRDTA